MMNSMPVGVPKRLDAPHFIEKLGNVYAKVGKTTIVDCVVKGEYDIDCVWYFEGKLINDEGRFRYLYEREDVVGLEICQITVEDEGEYTCVATNKHGKAESRCEIFVNAEGQIIDSPKDSTYDETQTAVFKCKYDGNPRPEVKWFLGKKEIKNGSKYNISNKSQVASLEIYDLTVDDAGTYSIVVSNDAGEDEVTFLLTVNPNQKKTPPKEVDPISITSKIDVGEFPKDANIRKFQRVTRKKKRKSLLVGRDAIKQDNPESHYEFLQEIGSGRFSIVKKCRSKRTGHLHAAKIIKYECDFPNIEFALREYDLMCSGVLDHKAIPKLHDTWLVRKYLILVMDLCDGNSLLEYFADKNTFTEDDVVKVVKQLCHVLYHLHSRNLVHMDIRPSNIRYSSSGGIKLFDYNSARHNLNKRSRLAVDIIGHLEFCAPEVLEDDPILPGADMWSLGAIVYILCSGKSAFYHPSEEEIVKCIQKVNWKFDGKGFESITSEAKDFIRRSLVRIPEMRNTAAEALRHKWLSNELMRSRKSSVITVQARMKETYRRLCMEEAEDFLEASLVFRTFEEEEYDSPEESDADI